MSMARDAKSKEKALPGATNPISKAFVWIFAVAAMIAIGPEHLAMWMAGGWPLVVGFAITVIGVAGMAMRLDMGKPMPGASLFVVLGLILTIASSFPLPWYAYSVWIGLVFAALICIRKAAAKRPGDGRNDRATSPGNRRFSSMDFLAAAPLILFTCFHAFSTSSFWKIGSADVSAESTVCVIGDSLSADMEEGITPWPELLAKAKGIRVVNLARAGETLETAADQAKKMPRDTDLAILFIGGNDMLDGIGASDFEQALRRLVSELESIPRIAMVELPLPPLRNRIGRAQRAVALENKMAVLPRRCVAGVLGARDATADGLHLSARGHLLMAAQMARVVRVRERTGRGK